VTAEDTGDREEPRGKAALSQVADARLLARLAARLTVKLVREFALPLWLREQKTHLDPRDWGAGYLAVHDHEPSHRLLADLREVAPQALLRDLYRPERVIRPVHLEHHEGTALDYGGRAGVREARAARERQPLPRVEPLVGEVLRERERRRRLLAEPWQPALPDDAPRRSIFV
jgi:hypothetical protein